MTKLRTTLPKEVQSGLDDTAGATLTGLGRELNRGIQNPSEWIRVRPNSTNSAVVASKPVKGRSRGDAGAEIRVNDRQSAVLKFGLAGETVRRPGDVGVGSRMFWVGQEKALQDAQGIRMTPEGGLPPGTLKKLSSRAKRKGKRVPGSKNDVFFGRPKGRTGRAVGFWQRPADRTHSLRLLVAAVHEIRTTGAGWCPSGIAASKRGPTRRRNGWRSLSSMQ